jgi:hypothetical protein
MRGVSFSKIEKGSASRAPRLFRSGDIYLRFNDLIISKDFCENFDSFFEKKKIGLGSDRPGICFKLRVQGRICVNHRELILEIVRWLDLNLEPTSYRIYLDGLTSYPGMTDTDSETLKIERDLVDEICSEITNSRKNLEIISLVGSSLAAKVSLIERINLYIAPIGSGGELYGWVKGIPGIYFGPQRMIDLAEGHKKGIQECPPSVQLIKPIDEFGPFGEENYKIDCQEMIAAVKLSSFFMRSQNRNFN